MATPQQQRIWMDWHYTASATLASSELLRNLAGLAGLALFDDTATGPGSIICVNNKWFAIQHIRI